jgi:hypothetical protein
MIITVGIFQLLFGSHSLTDMLIPVYLMYSSS